MDPLRGTTELGLEHRGGAWMHQHTEGMMTMRRTEMRAHKEIMSRRGWVAALVCLAGITKQLKDLIIEDLIPSTGGGASSPQRDYPVDLKRDLKRNLSSSILLL